MTQLSSFGAMTFDVTAAAQQLEIVAALYNDRRDAVEVLLGPDGSVLRWTHQPASWLPSWCLIRSGTNRYFVVLAGTTNGWQGARHLDGSFGRPYVGQSNLLINGQWLGAWEAIETDVLPLLPGGPAVTVYVSGHSYGGAVAQAGAFSLQQRAVYGRIECLTIGQPKMLTAGYTGPLPAVYWRLSSWQDLVSTLPLDNLIPGTDHWALPLVWRQAVADWVHYGDPAYIGMNGGIQSAGANVEPPPPGVAVTPVSEHLLPNYSARLRQNLRNFGSNPAAVAALDLTDTVLAGGAVQTIPPGLPNVVPGPDGAPVTIPGAVPGSSVSSSVGANMADVVWPIDLDGQEMKINFLFKTDGGGGWSENFLFVVTAGDPYKAAADWARGYALYRRAILSNAVTIIAVRISNDAVTRDSYRISAPGNGLGEGTALGKSTDPESGFMLTLQDATRIVTSNNMLRGFPDDLLRAVTLVGNVVQPMPGPVRGYLNAIQTLFNQPYTGPSGGTGQICIRSQDRNPANWRTFNITAAESLPNCMTKLTYDGSPGAVEVGTEFYFATKRNRCVRGVSGYYDVIQIGLAEGFPWIIICKAICCGITELLCTLPKIQVKDAINAPVKFIDINRQTDRDVGRPFGGSRGKGKVRA